jgi:membrane-bound ClpP family serine protease
LQIELDKAKQAISSLQQQNQKNIQSPVSSALKDMSLTNQTSVQSQQITSLQNEIAELKRDSDIQSVEMANVKTLLKSTQSKYESSKETQVNND